MAQVEMSYKDDSIKDTTQDENSSLIDTGFNSEFSTITPHSLYEKGLHSINVPVKPILLTVAGIPTCCKSKSLMEMLNHAVSAAKEAMRPLSSYNRSGGGCGLPYYEMVAVGAPLVPPVYKEATKDTCYQFAMDSAIRHYSKQISEPIVKIDFTTLNEGYFGDEDLELHFCRIFEYLKKNQEAASESSDWQRKISNGLALINIWDIGVNKAVFHFLPALWGHLHKSYLWLFLDIDQDITNLYRLPDLPEKECNKDKKDRELIMRYRCCLHYLLRHVMLVRSRSKTDKSHEPNCSVFALQEHGVLDNLNKIKDEIMSVARKMGVKSSMNEHITVLQPGANGIRSLQHKLDAIVNKTLDSAENIPLSFVFLRSFFYAHEMMYITKSELKTKASKLKMTDDQTEKFCKIFMSSGSIIDVSQIDPTSSYVIVKPMKFLSELDKLFYATSDIDSLLPEYGLLTQETGLKIFGSTYQFFMDVLLSVDLALKVTGDQVNCDHPLSPREIYLYLPDIRIQPPILTCDLSALHLKLNINSPLSHLQVLFAKAFLSCQKQSVLVLERNVPVNVTKFKTKLVNREDIDIQLKYLGDVVEFQILERSSLPNESVYVNVVKACNEMMEKSKWLETKYNFVMMCAENEDLSDPNRLHRTCHDLPSDLCQYCQKSDEHYRHLQLWNAAIRKEKVLNGRVLSFIGGLMSVDDVCRIAEKINGLSNDVFMNIVGQLEASEVAYCKMFQAESFNEDRSKSMLHLLLDWENRVKRSQLTGQEKDPKIELAKKFVETAHSKISEKDQDILKDIARHLNMQTSSVCQCEGKYLEIKHENSAITKNDLPTHEENDRARDNEEELKAMVMDILSLVNEFTGNYLSDEEGECKLTHAPLKELLQTLKKEVKAFQKQLRRRSNRDDKIVVKNSIPDSGGSKFSCVCNKSPKLKHVLSLLKEHSSLWDEFARELNVENLRNSLQHKEATDDKKLELVLTKWIQNQTSDVTWKKIVSALVSMERKDVAQRVHDQLCDQLFDEYVNNKDYSHFEYDE